MDISECEVTPDGKAFYHCLYRYHIRENKYDGNQFVISGEFEKSQPAVALFAEPAYTIRCSARGSFRKFTRKELTA